MSQVLCLHEHKAMCYDLANAVWVKYPAACCGVFDSPSTYRIQASGRQGYFHAILARCGEETPARGAHLRGCVNTPL